MSKPLKTILIMMGAAILLLCAVLGILYLRSDNPKWTACGAEDSKYPCSYRNAADGLHFRIAGTFPEGSVWQTEAVETVQITEVTEQENGSSDKQSKKAEKKSKKAEKKAEKKNKKADKKANKKTPEAYTEFLLTGSFGEEAHAGFILSDAEQQPLCVIGITVLPDAEGKPAVQECTLREISATLEVDGEWPYTVTTRLDGSLLFRLKKADAEGWSVYQKKDLMVFQRIIDKENPDGISWLIIGSKPGDTDTALVYHNSDKIEDEQATAIRLDITVQPDGSTVLTGHGMETVSLREMSGEPERSIAMEDIMQIARGFAAEQLLNGEEAQQEVDQEYREIPMFEPLPEQAVVDFYGTASDGASGEVQTVRFYMNGAIWWLFSTDTLSEEQLIDLIDDSDAYYDTTELGGTSVTYRSDGSRNVFCWTGDGTMLLFNQEEPELFGDYTDAELEERAERAGTTAEALREQDRYWPCADIDTAFETARVVCETVR